MNVEELKKRVSGIHWHHKIDFGNGIVTPGGGDNVAKLERIGLPKDLTGKTVLDIGAWDGFFSFESEKRGASRVLALDSFVWKASRSKKAGFNLAREALNSKVEDVEMEVLDISPEKIGTFDLTLFLGVLYHIRHPLLALEKVFSVTKEMAIIETEVDMLDVDRPAIAFYPGKELEGDPTNWCGPNPQAVEAMLTVAGFSKVKLFFNTPISYRKSGIWKSSNQYIEPEERIKRSRMIFHAWR